MAGDEDAMWALSEELEQVVDDPDDVAVAQIGGDRAYVVLADSKGDVEELTGLEVDAADEVDVIEPPSDAEYGVAFKVEE